MVKDVRPAIRTILLDDSGVSVAVGGVRIYPIKMPQGMRHPSVVYSRVSEIGDHHMQGPSGLVFQRFQIDAWADNPDSAEQLANRVKGVLDGFRGEVLLGNDSPPDSVFIQGVFAQSSRDDYDSQSDLYRSGRDYFIDFVER